RLWFGSASGLKAVAKADLDAETQGQLARVLEALRRDGSWALSGQALADGADGSRDQFEKRARFARAFKRAMAARQDVVQAGADLAQRLAPPDGEKGLSLAEVLAPAQAPVANVTR